MAAPSANPGPVPRPDARGEPGDIGELKAQVRELQQRVLILETRLPAAPATHTTTATPAAVVENEPALTQADAGFALPPNTISILGRMLVAIAGAYVLRALTEFGALPAAAGVAIGLFYALFWLWIAARSPVEARFAAALTCATSVIIMAPLIWEATGRLKVMSSGTSAGVLAAFAVLAIPLGSGKVHGIIRLKRAIGHSTTGHSMITGIAGVASIAMAIALLFARDDIVPFTAALLVIAAAMEFAAWRGLPSGPRAFAAIAADFSVLVFSYLIAGQHRMPDTWTAVSPHAVLFAQLTLPLIYIATAVIQTAVRRRTLGFAEMAQTAAVLLIGIGGAAWVYKEERPVMFSLGIAALAGGLACYAISFRLFERENKWNFRAWATFGLFLVLAGIFLPFSRTEFWLLSCACAVACCWTANGFRLPTLGLHGAAYLVLGSAAAGVTSQPWQALFGNGTGPVGSLASIAVLGAATACWLAITGFAPDAPGRWRKQISSLAMAAQIAWIILGLAVAETLGIWRMAAGANAGGIPADTLATLVLTALSIALAWAGNKWDRRELVWLLCGIMALGAYKLAARDFPNAHSLSLVVSLLCYGGTLIVLPRMLPRMLRGGPLRPAT
jgi:hypothetical protein